jgi:hypothetical protein
MRGGGVVSMRDETMPGSFTLEGRGRCSSLDRDSVVTAWGQLSRVLFLKVSIFDHDSANREIKLSPSPPP